MPVPLLTWSTFNKALPVDTCVETCEKCVLLLLPIAPWFMAVGAWLETMAERGPNVFNCEVPVAELNRCLSRRIVSSTYL